MTIDFRRFGKRHLLVTAAFCQSFAAVTPACAAASDTAASPVTANSPADAGNGLTDIVVTATKRDTNLQKTPISIAVLNAAQMDDRHVLSLGDLGDGAIPSLRVAPFFARNSALTLNIRGIGAQSDANQPARDAGVGVYLDGIYLGRAQGLGAALYDVAQIEVDKGPQGTLFGRNTEGGAVSITTRKPTGKFDMNATFGAGNYDGYEASAHVDLPTTHDISFKFDAVINARDGTVTNPLAGQLNFNAYSRRGFAGQALWQPAGNFSADYAYDISYDASTPYYVQLTAPGYYSETSPLNVIQPTRATVGDYAVPLQWSVTQTNGHRLTLDWQLAPSLEIKSLSSYRELSQSQYDDSGTVVSAVYAGPTATFGRYSQAHQWQKQFSEELQAIGSTSTIKYVGGAFFYEEKVHDNAWTPNPLQWNGSNSSYIVLTTPATVSAFPDRASTVTSQSVGVFGQATWTPTFANSIAHLTLGGRYTHDHKDGALTAVNGALPVYVNSDGVTVTGAVPLDKSWDHFDPLINLSLDASDTIHFYAKWSTGYKAGGANSRSLTYRAYSPEKVSAFEVGAKTEFFDHHVRFNIDGFSEAYIDPQIDFNAVFLVNGSNRATIETVNAQGSGRSKGIEADVAISPARGLTLTASYTYTDMTMPVAANPFANNALVTVYPLYTPPSAASGAIDWALPLGGLDFRAHLDANYADGQHTSAADPTLSDKSFIVNGRVSLANIRLADSGASLTLSLWSRNLFDEGHAFYKSASVYYTYAIFNEPRTFGGTANFKF